MFQGALMFTLFSVANGAVVPLGQMDLGTSGSARGSVAPIPAKAATTAAWALSITCRGGRAAELEQLLGIERCPVGLVELLGEIDLWVRSSSGCREKYRV